jgi:hypothetical protein
LLSPTVVLNRSSFELRQLPGAAHAVGVDQQRHVALGVAVLGDVQVEHELRQRAVHARQAAAQHGEARAGQLGAGLGVEPAVAFASAMWSRTSNSNTRGVPTRLTSTFAFSSRPSGHVRLRDVGDAQRDRVELGADLVQARLPALELLAQAGHLRHDLRHVLAARLGHADGL